MNNAPDSPPDPRRARLARAEALLDRWLVLFEEALGREGLRLDPSKTTELANVFTICKRILEIEVLARRLATEGGSARDALYGSLDSNLFGGGVPADDEDGDAG